MKIGCCGSAVAKQPDGTGVEVVEQLRQIGYDYIELSLAQMAELSDEEYDELTKRVYSSGIKCEACNNFFPPDIRLTGDEVNIDKIMDYVENSLKRAAQLDVRVIVFGSAGAKNVPDGFSVNKAWEQIVRLLRNIDPVLKKYGIIVAIEPLNRIESNIINTVEEGLKLAREVNRDRIKLLVDFYHLAFEKEDPRIILDTGDYIRHVHFAELEGRAFPKDIDDSYVKFFDNLKEIGYEGRVSLEAGSNDFYSDAVISLTLLKQLVT